MRGRTPGGRLHRPLPVFKVKLGPLVQPGKLAVGIELHQPLMDGGGTTPPQFGPYGLDRTWLIEGYGVDPDIEVQNMPGDVVRGQDAQLDTAIEDLMKRIEEDPRDVPLRPPYPDKSKKD